MKKGVKVYTAVALVLTVVLGGAAAMKMRELKNSTVAEVPPAGLPVETVAVERTAIAQELSYVGTVEAWEEVDISAKISARILGISGREGDHLNKGQVAVHLENSELASKVNTLEKRVQTAKVNVDYWVSQVERLKGLYEEGALPRQEYDKAEFSLNTASSAYEEAKSALSEARVAQQNAVVTAPMNGTVLSLFANPGDLAVPGKPILRLADTSKLKVMVKVVEADLPKLKPGAPVKLMLGEGATPYRAEVTGVYPALDRTARTGTVEITAPAAMVKQHNLKPGMSVSVAFVLGEQQQALVVPRQTVQTESEGSYVYTVKAGKAVKQQVKTGLSNAKAVEIIEGLNEGQPVVSTGLEEVADGVELYLK